MQLAWITDAHMEWMSQEHLDTVYSSLRDSEASAIVVSGDISNAKHIKKSLKLLAGLPAPVYFVLGNHDIYGSSFDYVHNIVRKSVEQNKSLIWLTESVPIQLTDQTFLVGHDSWADGRAGAGQKSGYLINDYRSISDFRGLSVGSVFSLMETLADTATRRINKQIRKIIEPIKGTHVIVVTHCPPFARAAKYRGGPTDPTYIPHFSNIHMGKMLRKVAADTGCRISVLCGHTHEECRMSINDKIGIWVGKPMSVYSVPVYTVVDADLGC